MESITASQFKSIPNPQPTLTFHQDLLNSTAHHHAHLGNNPQMQNVINATNGTLDKTVLITVAATYNRDDHRAFVMACVILGLFFIFLVALVAVDMRAKYRSGELRDDMRGAKNILVLMVKLVPTLLVALFSKIGSLIPRKQAEPTEADSARAAQRARESQAIVQRLAAKSESEGTTTLSVASFGDNFDASS